MPTLADFKDHSKFARQHGAAQMQQLRAEFHRAALDMTQVTGIPEWDLLGTYLNGLIQAMEADNASLRRAMEAETLVDLDEISRLRQMVVANNIRIDMLEKVMAFPKTVIDKANQMEASDGR